MHLLHLTTGAQEAQTARLRLGHSLSHALRGEEYLLHDLWEAADVGMAGINCD